MKGAAGQRRLQLGLFAIVTIAAFEATALITALPTIADELNGDAYYGATLAANLLANIVVIVAAADAADRLGPARPLIVCAGLFVVGLAVAGVAPSILFVIIGRVLQGAGVGGFAVIAYVAVRLGIPQDRQPTTYALMSAGWVLPSLIAPALAGWVTDTFGWRWVFLGIIPLVLAAGLVVIPPLLTIRPAEITAPPDLHRLRAAVRLALGIGAVLGGLTSGSPTVTVPLVVVGGAVAAPAARHLFPRGVVRARPGLPAVIACRLLATMAFLGADSFLPLAADRIHGVGPIAQGMVIIGAALSWTIGQALAARWNGKVPDDRLVRFGFSMLLTGVIGSAIVLDPDLRLALTFAVWCVGGFGMGMLFNPTTVAAMGHAPDGAAGVVSSQLTMADSLGFALMSGVGGAVVAFADRSSMTLSAAIVINLALAATCAVLGLLASARLTVGARSAPGEGISRPPSPGGREIRPA
jgi:MFS family permease